MTYDTSQRSRGRPWRRLRASYLAEHPLCEMCEREGAVTAAQELDHIKALVNGGTDDWNNLQALCKRHHEEK